MTLQGDAVDLLRLSDTFNTLCLRILGRRAPGTLPLHDLLDAEIIVNSSFISGRLNICFYPSDLEEWSLALDALAAGRGIEWLDTGNGPTIKIEFRENDLSTPIVLVEDGSGSCTSATIPIALDDGWVDEQRENLLRVTQTWPSEVIKTSPGTFEWRDRKNDTGL